MSRIAILSIAILCLPMAREAGGQHLGQAAFRSQAPATQSFAEKVRLNYARETSSKGQWIAVGVVIGAVVGGTTLGLVMAERINECDGACMASDGLLAGAIGVGVIGGGALGGFIAAMLYPDTSQRRAR